MTNALPPQIAVQYLRELSTDIHGGVLFNSKGELVAGSNGYAAAAATFLSVVPSASEIVCVDAGGAVVAVRSTHHAMVVVCGPFALPGLILHDLRTVLSELDGSDSLGVGFTSNAQLSALVDANREFKAAQRTSRWRIFGLREALSAFGSQRSATKPRLDIRPKTGGSASCRENSRTNDELSSAAKVLIKSAQGA